MRDTIAVRCEPLRRESSGTSALMRRSGLPKRSTRQSKSKRVVNERNVCSQERDKGRIDTARQRQQTLFEERAHNAALYRLDMARRSSRRSAYVTRASGGAARPIAETA